MGIQSHAFYAQAPIFYLVDYANGKYLHLDEACEPLLGLSRQTLAEAGPSFYTSLWHRSDYRTYNSLIFPKIMGFLKSQPLETAPTFSFTFNYRVVLKDQQLLCLLQRSVFYLAPDHTPLAALGFVIDISHFKEDSRIIFTIEKVDKAFTSDGGGNPIYKAIYFPEKTRDVLSKREVEVLQCIHEGLSSKQIADRLCVSVNTIHNHRKKMLEKTSSSNTAELLSYSVKHGLI
ncbi:LuxR C-terminal-related transcriptional regulator [Rufibacter psychrotolerans]|uniref:LuxR C-terminal-related transcriptional regulator n=1 Tax=Rufibacter psychrotolerans TaxID=2812556 RepID=UPI00196703C9|nr:LuxR C-terminal-related transcriptional regulator [Rufibacter sp. SYSU D00308]